MKNKFQLGDKLPEVVSERLELTELTPDDAKEILEIFGDPEVMLYWGNPLFKSIGDAKYFIEGTIEGYSERNRFCWGIRWRETGSIVGTSTLFNFDLDNKRAEIGFAVARALWGQGIATEAIETVLGFAFKTLDFHRIEADVDPRNLASLHVLEKQGFVREGLLRERWHQMGEIQDSVLLGLLRQEWRRG